MNVPQNFGVKLCFLALLVFLTACGASSTNQSTESSPVRTMPPEQLDAIVAELAASPPADLDKLVTETDLEAIKAYTLEHTQKMIDHSKVLEANAERYFEIYEQADLRGYEGMWEDHQVELKQLMAEAKHYWLLSHQEYQLVEGIIAGVPSLVYYDKLLNTSLPAFEDHEEAVEWTLNLENGCKYEDPGSIFHYVLAATIWGTDGRFVGIWVDLDGDGVEEPGEAIPDAFMFLAATQAMSETSQEMYKTIEAWEPTSQEIYTLLITTLPDTATYFQQWTNSLETTSLTTGPTSARSRLADSRGVLYALNFIYNHISPEIAERDASLDQQTHQQFAKYRQLLDRVYEDERQGKQFSAAEGENLLIEVLKESSNLGLLLVQAGFPDAEIEIIE